MSTFYKDGFCFKEITKVFFLNKETKNQTLI